nr:hypothetical protein [Caulobacteraceae bacterium]
MTLADAAAVASIVSSVAVALSLVYLAVQVRQAEKNQRGLMQQGRADRASDAALRLADPQLSAVWNKGRQSPEQLSPEELDQFLMMCRMSFLSAEDSFLQHKAGLMDEAAYKSFAAGVRSLSATFPGLRAGWRMSRAQYGPEFAAFMDAIVSSDTGPPIDRLALWRKVVELERPKP